jgi:alpha-glucoside transport system substrate-binding protein
MGEAVRPRQGRMRRRVVLRAAVALPALPALSACAGLRGSVRVAVPWSGWELARFRYVLDGFTAYSGRGTEVVALGEDIGAVLGARASGAPDVALLPRPGLVDEYKNQLEAVDFAWRQESVKFSERWRAVVEAADGRLLGVPFKAANKSILWYRKDMLDRPPSSLPEFFDECDRLIGAGQPPLALGAADGWPLSDLFENMLLAVSPGAYRALANRRSSWQHRSVRSALTELGDLLSRSGVLAGGADGALFTQFEDSLLQVFEYGEAAMVVAPDFAYPVIDRYARLDDNVGLTLFPGLGSKVRDLDSRVVAGGDIAVLPKPGNDGGRELIKWLATKEAAERWASRGGFLAPHQGVPNGTYPDPRLANLAGKLREGFEFDLSDELGGPGGVLLRALQDFLATVGDGHAGLIEGAAQTVMDQVAEAVGRA